MFGPARHPEIVLGRDAEPPVLIERSFSSPFWLNVYFVTVSSISSGP